jgi:hypothetical protein
MPDDMNREGDLVLIYYEDNPAVYARIDSVEPDTKKNWYQVTILLLTVPAQTVKPPYRKVTPEGSKQSLRDKGGDKSGKVIPFRKE